jgi:chitin synthase
MWNFLFLNASIDELIKFIVLMDLLSTAVMPAGLLATYFLIVNSIIQIQTIADNVTSIVLTALMVIVIFLPAILVIFTGRRFNYILWMFIYLLSLPVWQVILPLYAFWNFDDFSWGETRKVAGEKESKTGHGGDDNANMLNLIPFRRWDEYEREWRKSIRPGSVVVPIRMESTPSRSSYRASQRYSQMPSYT